MQDLNRKTLDFYNSNPKKIKGGGNELLYRLLCPCHMTHISYLVASFANYL